MADVSISALQKVKSALSAFQSDISGISFRTTQQSESCLNACKQKITECQSKVQKLDDEINKLNVKIESLDEQISSAHAQLQKIENELPLIERHLKGIATKIIQFQKKLAVLQARLAETEDSEKRQQIQSEINYVNQQIQALCQEQSDLEYQIQQAERTKTQLGQKIQDMKSEKSRCEQTLAIEKKRKNQYQDKYERMKNLQHIISSNFDEYVGAVRKFESTSEASAGQNKHALDKCISHIEEYLSLNL